MPHNLENEEIAQLQDRLAAYRQTLLHYLKQQSLLGDAYAPPAVTHGIREARREIRHIKQYLHEQGIDVEDKPYDEVFTAILRQIPFHLRHYVSRTEIEQKIRKIIIANNDTPLILLTGLSGTGKSSIAAHIARSISETDFSDGVLWGDLANLTSNDLLLRFLGALDSQWYRSSPSKNVSLRDAFWQTLSGKRALIIIDSVSDARQLGELLPANILTIGDCRVLAISNHQLTGLTIAHQTVRIGYFNSAETLALFRQHMDHEQVDHYEALLLEIGERLEYHPQLLATAARDFVTKKVMPSGYLHRLRRGESSDELLSSTLKEGLELAIRDLTPEQLDIFEHIGVFGEGDWSTTMLAAVALRDASAVADTLAVLVDYELVMSAGNRRYRTSSLIRKFVQHRFMGRSENARQTAYTLLARYCLDRAQDLDAQLAARPDLMRYLGQTVERTDPHYVQAFRAGLLPEMPHICEVLNWAEHQKDWDILLRFSYLPYMELLKNLIANAFEVQISLRMATIVEPIIWLQGERKQLQFESLITSASWVCGTPPAFSKPRGPDLATDGFNYTLDEPPAEKACCELSLNIAAGHVIDGLFHTLRLIDTQWTGVRASGLICCAVDIVGGQFLACDLSHSIWFACDARQITMLGSNLSYALLCQVKLHGANLQGIQLNGAVLEQVDLRGANLRGADLAGVVMEDVDLRGADLREARLTAVQARNVNLIGCRLEGARWDAARLYEVYADDKSVLLEIDRSAQECVNVAPELFQRRSRPVKEITGVQDKHMVDTELRTEIPSEQNKQFADTDLRAVDLTNSTLADYVLKRADLRAATLTRAGLNNADLRQADLRGADLTEADLTGANLRGANLSMAILTDAVLENTDLNHATLRAAHLARTRLRKADLQTANLRSANLANAVLRYAVLTDSDLEQAHLKGAILIHADLRRARLHGADLTQADLTDADLTGALCTWTNFRDALVSNRQLAQTQRLEHAILPSGEIVEILGATYDSELIPIDMFLCFAQCDGVFHRIDLAERNLLGAHLEGKFVTTMLTGSNLSYARLSGYFSQVNLSGADMTNADICGDFSATNFSGADFAGARLREAVLIRCDLTGARNLQEATLRRAKQLRGTRMPDGTRYDGRFDLVGDREDARNLGIDPDDHQAMQKRFYGPDRPRYTPQDH